MCYKITSLFGYAHGHAAALCVRKLFPCMVANVDQCIDPRGEEYLKQTLNAIGLALGGKDAEEGGHIFSALYNELELPVPEASEDKIAVLSSSVNPVRLKNHPMKLGDVPALYREILGGKHEG